jgi:hypothetical protein
MGAYGRFREWLACLPEWMIPFGGKTRNGFLHLLALFVTV